MLVMCLLLLLLRVMPVCDVLKDDLMSRNIVRLTDDEFKITLKGMLVILSKHYIEFVNLLNIYA